MPHQPGTYLGGVRDSESLRQRCYVDDCGCWHLRTGHGLPLPRGKRVMVHVHGAGSVTATRAALLVSGRELPPRGSVAYRTCTSYDCVNPEHVAVRTKSEHGLATGRGNVAVKTAANIKAGAKRCRLTPQQRARVEWSDESPHKIAREVGITPSWAYEMRRRAQQRTVQGVREMQG